MAPRVPGAGPRVAGSGFLLELQQIIHLDTLRCTWIHLDTLRCTLIYGDVTHMVFEVFVMHLIFG